MNAQKLSKRLAKVASFVPTGAVVADIGSDHAYLPCYLVHNGIASRAIAGEVVQGPYDSAVRQVRTEGLTDKITVRFADGLAAVTEDDKVDTITICGMGGPLIVSILTKNPESLQHATRLILQPNIHAKVIREWALQNKWAIQDEEIIEDVILEEADPRLPELDDSLASEENVEADMEITLDQPEVESVMDIAQVAVSEKEEPKKLSSLMETSIWEQYPARASSILLSTTS